MQMTFQQYIDNPLGKKNAVFSQRDMYKNLYTTKFDAVLLREAGKIDYTLYCDDKNDEFYIHIKIPSEVVPKFYYDVVIQFYTTDNAIRTENSLNRYNVRFFSNDPSFCFTYLKVFLDNDMFVEFLKPKAPKQALKKDPVEKNPYKIPGYVKSIYWTYLYMRNKNLFNKYFYREKGVKFKPKQILSNVTNAVDKINDRQIEGEKVLKERRKEEKKKANKIDIRNQSMHSDISTKISSTKNTKTSKKSSGVKTVKSIKRQ